MNLTGTPLQDGLSGPGISAIFYGADRGNKSDWQKLTQTLLKWIARTAPESHSFPYSTFLRSLEPMQNPEC
jgi:hypothetical protein